MLIVCQKWACTFLLARQALFTRGCSCSCETNFQLTVAHTVCCCQHHPTVQCSMGTCYVFDLLAAVYDPVARTRPSRRERRQLRCSHPFNGVAGERGAPLRDACGKGLCSHSRPAIQGSSAEGLTTLRRSHPLACTASLSVSGILSLLERRRWPERISACTSWVVTAGRCPLTPPAGHEQTLNGRAA